MRFNISIPGVVSKDPFSPTYIPSLFKHVSSPKKRKAEIIHVERVIAVVRQKYMILQGTIALLQSECGPNSLDKIVHVACALSNMYCESIVPFN